MSHVKQFFALDHKRCSIKWVVAKRLLTTDDATMAGTWTYNGLACQVACARRTAHADVAVRQRGQAPAMPFRPDWRTNAHQGRSLRSVHPGKVLPKHEDVRLDFSNERPMEV
jgi:hypothetical protein